MRAIIRIVVLGWLIAAVHSSAFACGALYQPTNGLLSLPCLDIFGDSRIFSATLQHAGGQNFVVTDVRELELVEPLVIGFRIFAAPNFHVAAVSGFYGACGSAALLKPTVTQTGDNVDVRVKVRVPPVNDPGCQVASVALQPFSEAATFFLIGDVHAKTYSINGKPASPTFGCEAPTPVTRPTLGFC